MKFLPRIKFGWLADGRWPLKFWEAFWIRKDFTLCGPMTTVAFGPLVMWVYWISRPKRARRTLITIENAGQVTLALAGGFIAGVFCFLIWAILEHGAQ